MDSNNNQNNLDNNTDFNDNEINVLINDKLLVYNYYYQLFD